MSQATLPEIRSHVPIRTWFGVGGGADRFAVPGSVEELRACLELDPKLRVLGDGANLLVDDDGVGELVVSLASPAFQETRIEPGGRVTTGGGCDLPKLILACVRAGLGGLEGLGGIPATLGGALVMNAGGAFGQICDVVQRVHAMDRAGRARVLDRGQIPFSYRRSGLNDVVVTGAELRLTPGDPAALRERLKEVMAYKKESQPMGDSSAGCCFKNPTLTHDLNDIAPAGARVSAGLLIDRAGCKGLAVRGAEVSHRHANFLVARPGAKARDVIDLMGEVTRRVREAFGVTLEPEVVVWRRGAER